MTALPDFVTPEQLADHLGWSSRELRKKAREIGACRILGNAMILTPIDVAAILEATRPCPSLSSSEAKSGITAVPSKEGGYEALLALRTKKKPKATPSTLKPKSGNVVDLSLSRT